MSQYDVLQRIPLMEDDDPDYGDKTNYELTRDGVMMGFGEFLSYGMKPNSCVVNEFWHGEDAFMDENGMEKLTCMIAGALFEIEHGQVEPDLAHGVLWDIRDFETGNYDDLFTAKELEQIREDIRKIKESLEQHPELLKQELKPLADIKGDSATSSLRRWFHIQLREDLKDGEDQT